MNPELLSGKAEGLFGAAQWLGINSLLKLSNKKLDYLLLVHGAFLGKHLIKTIVKYATILVCASQLGTAFCVEIPNTHQAFPSASIQKRSDISNGFLDANKRGIVNVNDVGLEVELRLKSGNLDQEIQSSLPPTAVPLSKEADGTGNNSAGDRPENINQGYFHRIYWWWFLVAAFLSVPCALLGSWIGCWATEKIIRIFFDPKIEGPDMTIEEFERTMMPNDPSSATRDKKP